MDTKIGDARRATLRQEGPRSRSVRAFTVLASSALVLATACYSDGDGTAPPRDTFYFPVGLAVSSEGEALYVVNSDFDLQWNGGTLQSYDLAALRRDAALSIVRPNDPSIPVLRRNNADGTTCQHPTEIRGLGETCAPPVDSRPYNKDSVVIGAFATDLRLVYLPFADGTVPRLFMPVRGDGSLSWVDIANDGAGKPFKFDCGVDSDGRCAPNHRAGGSGDTHNDRRVSMPGEPFGMAITSDPPSNVVITHQSDTKTSLFSTGYRPQPSGAPTRDVPSIQFVLDGVASGGNGIVEIPHDKDAFDDCDPALPTSACIRPSFLQTSRASNELAILRYFPDENTGDAANRPFIVKERTFDLVANAGGSDSRGIAIDASNRDACKAQFPASDRAHRKACARLPARVYFANRSPSTVVIGEIGGGTSADRAYDPDRLTVFGTFPVSEGPAKLYLAPVINSEGRYSMRLFVACTDSSTIFVYDPKTSGVDILRVGQGPFAVAFDPFDPAKVARGEEAEDDPVLQQPQPDGTSVPSKKYRFAYVASFTKSFIQVVDLDNSRSDKSTYKRVVMTLGLPTLPKGSK